jgi:hypothetical protein
MYRLSGATNPIIAKHTAEITAQAETSEIDVAGITAFLSIDAASVLESTPIIPRR